MHNLGYDIDWDSDEELFHVPIQNKHIVYLESLGYHMHPAVPEILVWSKSLDFQTIYIARKKDFDEVEMF
jgi:hypothetical protein